MLNMDATVCLAKRVKLEHSYAVPIFDCCGDIKQDQLCISTEATKSPKIEIDVNTVVKSEDHTPVICNENSSADLPSANGVFSNECLGSMVAADWETLVPKKECVFEENLANKIKYDQEHVPKQEFLKCKRDYESAFEQLEKEKNALDEKLSALQKLLNKSKEEKIELRNDVIKLRKIIINMTAKEMELRKTLDNRELMDKYSNIAYLKKQLSAAKMELQVLRSKPEDNLMLTRRLQEVRETKKQVRELQKLLYTERKINMTHSWQAELKLKKANKKLLEAQRVTAKLRQSLTSSQATLVGKGKELKLYKGRVNKLNAEVKELSARLITAMSKDVVVDL